MSRYLGESAMQWGLCLFALLPGCSEPFDRPELPDDLSVLDGAMQAQSAATASRASIPDASAASAASAGDGGTSLSSSRIVESRAARSSAEGSGDGSEDSDDEKEQTTAISEQAEAFGDLLTLRGGQISVTRGARVLLRCVGERQTFGRSSEFSCQSMLQVMEKRGREEVVLAEEKGVADLSGFEADGGSSQSTHSLSLFPLRRVPALSLIRVEQSHEQNESLIERSSKGQTFYALGEGKLVKVFELVTSSRDHLDADPELEHDEIETRVLRVGKTETNGLPDLEISETLTTMKERRSQRKRSRMRAVWNGEGYDVCPAKLDQSAHCGACGHRCAVGEGCCGQRCVALQSAAHCGACNHSCRSVGGGSVPFCADPAKGRCELACTANAFDLDGRDDNGCEYSAKNEGHSTEATAIDRGSRRCSDADSRDQLTAELVSDLRRHAPAGATGPLELVRAAPVYVRAKAEGGALCQNDLEATLRVAGPAADVPCYRLTVRTDRGQRSVSVRAGGEATIRAGRGAYTSGATVLFKIEQRCQPTQPQATQITLSYHL